MHEDLPRILDLYGQLVISSAPSEVERKPEAAEYRQTFNEILAMPGHELVVAEENGEVVGTMALLIVPNLSHQAMPWAYVENMVVDSARQRQGYGRLLMEYAFDRARKAGCYKVQLASTDTRDAAHLFYESQGFSGSAVGFRRYL
jgi:GNAT superfamily N-acetyltransferase